MNYYWILFALSFVVFGIHNSISSRVKEASVMVEYNSFSFALLRGAPLLGYILLAISLFLKTEFIYAVLIFLFGVFFAPSILLKVLSVVLPYRLLKNIINPYPNTIITYVLLSISMIILLIIGLLM